MTCKEDNVKKTLEPVFTLAQKEKLFADVGVPTPDHVLRTQLMDCRIPKEEVHAYARRLVIKLEEENERLRQRRTEIDDEAFEYAEQSEELKSEIKRLKETNAVIKRVTSEWRSEWLKDAKRYRSIRAFWIDCPEGDFHDYQRSIFADEGACNDINDAIEAIKGGE